MSKKRKKLIRLVPGVTVAHLTVIRYDHTGNHHRRYFLFECDCGVRKIIHGSAVTTGNTKSCGCLVKRSALLRRKPNNGGEVTAILLGYKRHARDRGLSWRLSRKFTETLIKKPCHYCGCPPLNRKTTKNSVNGGLLYSGIDRVDSRFGYSTKNVVPCCKVCNYAKSTMTLDEFRAWAIRLGQRAGKWG